MTVPFAIDRLRKTEGLIVITPCQGDPAVAQDAPGALDGQPRAGA